MTTIRPLAENDRNDWQTLWEGYLTFYGAEVPTAVSQTTWERLHNESIPMFGLVAENDAGQVVGLTHCVIHLNTWTEQPICYLEDLFVDPSARQSGIGRKLIEAVAEKARAENWGRLYWMTKEDNETARTLYDKVARFTGFVRYDYPLK